MSASERGPAGVLRPDVSADLNAHIWKSLGVGVRGRDVMIPGSDLACALLVMEPEARFEPHQHPKPHGIVCREGSGRLSAIIDDAETSFDFVKDDFL